MLKWAVSPEDGRWDSQLCHTMIGCTVLTSLGAMPNGFQPFVVDRYSKVMAVLMEHAPEYDSKAYMYQLRCQLGLRALHPDTANMRNTVVNNLI